MVASSVLKNVYNMGAREAIQIHGGYGIMTEYPVFRYLRDALVYTIGEGTSEIQRNIIAKQTGL